MIYGAVENVGSLTLLDPPEAPGGPELEETSSQVDPLHVAMIDDIGAAVEEEQSTFPSALPLDAVIHTVLKDTIGSNRHSAEYQTPVDGRRPLARVKGFGIARGQGSPDNQTYTDGLVEPGSGSIVVARGDELGARTATQAFERKVRTSRAGLIDTAEASNIVEGAVRSTVPRVIRAARERLGVDPGSTEVTASGMQIVRNQVVHFGRDPMLVLNTKTGEITRLAYNADSMERGVHELSPGRYIVMMCSGTDPDFINTDTNTLGQALLEACAEPIDPTTARSLGTNEDKARAKAEQVAARVQTALGGSGQGVTVVTAAVEVAEPWRDRRSWPRRATDLGRLATFTTMTAAKFFDPTVRDLHRRELYERMKRDGIRGKVGQAALWTLDLGLATGLPLLALRFAAPELTHHLGQGIGQQIDHVGHLVGLGGHEDVVASGPAHAGAQAAGGAALTEGHPSVPSVNDDIRIDQLAHTANQQPATPAQFDATYTASAHDPRNGNGPTTISSMARQSFDFYGGQYHLPADEIAKLKQTGVDGAITAFEGDTSDPDNAAVTRYSERWVMDGTTYSLEAMNKEISGVVAADAHRLGLDAPQAAPQPQAADVAAPATQPPATTPAHTVATPPITPERTSQTEKLAMVGTVTAVGAGVAIAGGWLGLSKARSWLRKRRERKAIPAPSEPQEAFQESAADTAVYRPRYTDEVSADTGSSEVTEPSSPEHIPRHLSLVGPEHPPKHLSPTDPDGEPESLLGLEPVDMPEVPGLGFDPGVPRAPSQPFRPDLVDNRPAHIDAAYREFRGRRDETDIEIHWQRFSNQWAVIDARKNKNPLIRLGRRLFSRRSKTKMGSDHSIPDPTRLADYQPETADEEELIAA